MEDKITFIQEVPHYVEIEPTQICANSLEELLNNDYFKNWREKPDTFFCYSANDTLMIQMKNTKFWLVLGYINGIDLSKSGLPKWNPDMYDDEVGNIRPIKEFEIQPYLMVCDIPIKAYDKALSDEINVATVATVILDDKTDN